MSLFSVSGKIIQIILGMMLRKEVEKALIRLEKLLIIIACGFFTDLEKALNRCQKRKFGGICEEEESKISY